MASKENPSIKKIASKKTASKSQPISLNSKDKTSTKKHTSLVENNPKAPRAKVKASSQVKKITPSSKHHSKASSQAQKEVVEKHKEAKITTNDQKDATPLVSTSTRDILHLENDSKKRVFNFKLPKNLNSRFKSRKVDTNADTRQVLSNDPTPPSIVLPQRSGVKGTKFYAKFSTLFLTYKARRVSIFLVIFAIIVSLVSVGIVSLFQTPPDINFVTVASSSFSTANYVKEQSGRTVYSSVVEGLIAPSPVGVEPDKSDSLSTILSVDKLSFYSSARDSNSFDGFLANSPRVFGVSDSEYLTYGMADFVTFTYVPSQDPLKGVDQSLLSDDEIDEIVANAAEIGNLWKFHIRPNAFWANGDRVSAQDFVQTIKYAADLRTGSTLIRDFRDVVPLRGLGTLIKEQQDYYAAYGQYRSRLEEYSSYNSVFGVGGGVYALGNPAEPESSFSAYRGAQQLSNSYLYYQFEPGYSAADFFNKLGRPLFLPTNRRFVEKIGGIDNLGTSAENILSNGPFQIVFYDPDYQVTFEKSPTYWDSERTLVNRWAMRVLPDVATQIQLFKTGLLSEISVPAEYLKVFQESEELKKLLIKGGSSRSTRYFKWNLSNDNTLGNTAVHPKLVNNVHLRRAFSLALNRKTIIDTISAGDTTPSGDTFTPSLSQFTDRNGNSFDEYLYRANYKLNGVDLGSMKQFSPQDALKFDKATYIADIKRDSYTNLDLARRELEAFLTDMPEYRNKSIPIDIIYSTNDRFLVLRMQQNLDEAFNGHIVFNAKPLPDTIFNNRIEQNRDFDMAYYFNDPDSQDDAWTILRLLAAPVPLGTKSGVTTNITWGWTYSDGLKWLSANEPGRIYSDLGLANNAQELQELQALLDEMKKSSEPLADRAATPAGFVKENALFRSKIRTSPAKMDLYVKLEKIIRDQAPVVPLYQAPSGWYARQIVGATNISGFETQYKYAYNANKVPPSKYSLPGKEIYN